MSTRHVSWIMYISEFISHVNFAFQVEGGRVDPHHLVRSKFFLPPHSRWSFPPKKFGGEKATEDIQEESSLKKAKERKSYHLKRFAKQANVAQSGALWMIAPSLPTAEKQPDASDFIGVNTCQFRSHLICFSVFSLSFLWFVLFPCWSGLNESNRSVRMYICECIYIYIWICTKCRMWLCRYVYVNV